MEKSVIAYARQSLKQSDRESSTVAQHEAIIKYAQNKGMKISQYFTDTESGKNMNRQGMQSLIKKIELNQINKIIVWRMDRISRRTGDLLSFLTLCESHDVSIESINDNILSNHNAMDKFKVQTLAIIAELQRNIISENKQNGLRTKFNQGQPISTAAPFGYRYQEGQFHIVPEEAETVKTVFDLYLDGKGYKKISQITKEHTDLIFRTPQQVRYILMNEKSTGQYVGKYGRIADIIPPIITQETFKATETLRLSKQHKTFHPVPAKLRRKIQCPVCRGTMTPFHNRSQINSTPFYVCATRMQHQYDDCSMQPIPIKKIEHRTLQAVVQFLTSKEQLEETHEEILSRLKQKQKLQRQQSVNSQQQKNRLISLLADGQMSLQTFKKQIATLEIRDDTHADTLSLNVVTLEKLMQLIESHPDVKKTLWPIIENIKVTKAGELEAVHIIGFKQNILTQNLKEQMINEHNKKQAAD